MNEATIVAIAVPIVVAILSAVISGFASYFLAVRQSKNDLEMMKQEQMLSVEREARLFEYEKRYEQLQLVSAAFSKMQDAVHVLFPMFDPCGIPSDPEDERNYREQRYIDAIEQYNSAYAAITAIAPFISQDLLDEGKNITHNCSVQIGFYADIYLRKMELPHESEMACFERTKEISADIQNWNSHIREALDAGQLELSHVKQL